MQKVSVIGAGLAGCEVAYQLAVRGIDVDLFEMKPAHFTPAHQYAGFAELVCSNSLKAMRLETAAGLLKHEMELMDSLILKTARLHAVPAGGALAVDRTAFSDAITEQITQMEKIHVHHQKVDKIPSDGVVVIAAGPLATQELSTEIATLLGENSLHFYDAAAPIVDAESIDRSLVFEGCRYDRGEASDYLNCPMNKEQYERFFEALLGAQTAQLKEFEQSAPDQKTLHYEGCMPIEVLAKRGVDTMRFGPLKPVGLRCPDTGKRPWAVVQLRKENKSASMYNLVGFQTNLTFLEQKRVFSLIPGLSNAEFLRYGVMHRNTFLNSPETLTPHFSVRTNPRLFFAGQITGVEGYLESAASGLLASFHVANMLQNKSQLLLPEDCMLGALSRYVSDQTVHNFQPMGANMGLLPPLGYREKNKVARYEAVAMRAIESLTKWVQNNEVH